MQDTIERERLNTLEDILWGGTEADTPAVVDEVDPSPEKWDVRPETYININGSFVDVQEGSPFMETVLNVAKEASLGKFRVFKDGEEILNDGTDMPETFEFGTKVDVFPYDLAA